MYLCDQYVSTLFQPEIIMTSVKVLLYIHKELKDGSHPIVLSIIKRRDRKMISTGYSATKAQWKQDGKGLNTKHPHFKKLNSQLIQKRMEVESAIIDLEGTGKPYSVEDVAEMLKKDKKAYSFKQFTQSLISRLEKADKMGNSKVYNNALESLVKFNGSKDIDFTSITPRFLERYRQSLMEQDVKVNAISVYLRTIRAIYNKAIQEDLVSEKHYPFKKIKIKTEPTQKRAVSKEIIGEIKKLDLTKTPRQDLARDIFLFSLYNRGMNFIDIFYLKPSDIKDERVRYRRRKTKQTLSIKLTTQSKEIIAKYYQPGSKQEFIFPILKKGNEYNSYRTGLRGLNRGLKDISEKLATDVTLSSYVARHSWATIAKRSGVSTAIISEGLAHDTEKTTQIYLDSFEDETLDDANDLIIGDL